MTDKIAACNYCGGTGKMPEGTNACFSCWEVYEEEGGPQLDPEETTPEDIAERRRKIARR